MKAGAALDEATIDMIDERALELVAIAHGDGGKHDIARLTRDLDRAGLIALAVSVAALVDPDKSQAELLAWLPEPDRHEIYQGWTADELRNAHAAYSRGVRMDQIVKGEQIYQHVMYKRRTGSAASA